MTDLAVSSPSLALLPDLRADFPFFQVHPDLTFLDSAASTQKPQAVIDALTDFYTGEYANIHRGAYRLSALATDRFERVREQSARFFGAPAAEGVIFTRNATESINLVAQTWGRAHLGAGDVILVTELEHHANLVPWQLLAHSCGARVVAARLGEGGTVDLEDYAAKLRSLPVRLVAAGHVSNVLGTVNPVRHMTELAHEHGAAVLLDGAQAAPHLQVNVQELGADFYVLSSHKMLGPGGVGLLIARPERLRGLPPYQGGGGMIDEVTVDGSTYAPLPGRYEAGTPAIAEVIGFGAALDYLGGVGPERVAEHEQALLRLALSELEGMPGLTLYGAGLATLERGETERCGVLPFNVRGAHPHDVAGFLDEEGVCVRAGHHCAQPLMRALGAPGAGGLAGTVRASFYLYNTPDDVHTLVRALRGVSEFFGEEADT
ncbi:cysteine desulfurase / selenocysteine lyase [Deinococcus reticulitermitis]|uniref:cysteine desulfurase n=1 Tax=Deinococcus reticulitermitis TaxID=856736 RepID=A0A1H7CG79_9DEIO|nr:SufS family cysteine desulfurase [Deinococcus reticulitermitis]SEJ87607.1 cysteine desulfurase / selenocysteine lyase [Deinococcus reticulitermitis]